MKELLTEAEEGLRDPDSQKLGAVTSPGWAEGEKGGTPVLEAVRAAEVTVNLGAVVMVRRRRPPPGQWLERESEQGRDTLTLCPPVSSQCPHG